MSDSTSNSTSSIRILEEIFHHAVALNGADRRAYLDRTCTDGALRATIDHMLACEDTAPDFLEAPLHHAMIKAGPGDMVGRWTILELIGEGGLGLVYRASSDQDGVTVDAALKLLRPGWDEGLFQRRFVQERQILARLEHPGIARLIDCGADQQGRSFLAMEYVEGRTLDRYLEDESPPLPRRIEIFQQIAEAVRYLHGRLIVHGDLKPANVIVTAEGRPKVLDFGTARWLRSEAGAGNLTRLLLTPRFASPEQKAGEPTSVLSDIYSLGRLLEETLAPVDCGADLRAVLARCLADDPAARYPSAADLIEDLTRWREGLPVRARRLTLAYAASRFARRNLAACALATALTATLATGWWLARRQEGRTRSLAAAAERNAAAAELQKGRAEAATGVAEQNARRFRAITQQLLGDATDASTPGAEQHAVLERSLRQAIAELERAPDPSLAPELSAAWRRLSSELCQRGDFRQGLPAFDRAVAYAREWAQHDSGSEAQRNYALLRLRKVELLRDRGDMERAIPESSAALRSFDQLPAALRADLESSSALQNARIMAAQDEISVTDRIRLLSIAMQTSHRLRYMQPRNRALSLLIVTHAADPAEVARLCELALDWQVSTPTTRQSCGDTARAAPDEAAPPPPTAVLTPDQLSETLMRVQVAQRTLSESPRNFRANLDLGRAYARMAEHYFATGKQMPGETALRHAEAALKELTGLDPESPAVVMFGNRVKRLQSR